MNDENETQATNKPTSKQHNSGAADLERVTDYAEEKEIAASGGDLNNAMNAISDKRKKEAEIKAEREKRLASVKVKKEDVEMIMTEFEITKPKAERVLKEHNADVSAALRALINS